MNTSALGDGPRETPSVAVEHGQCPKIAGMLGQIPCNNITNRVQICTSMVVDNTLRIACCARSIIEGNGIPFIKTRPQLHLLRAGRQKRLIFQHITMGLLICNQIDHLDEQHLMVHHGHRLIHNRPKCGIKNQYLGNSMIKDKGHGCRIKPRVDGIQDPTGHRDAIMGLEHLGYVWKKKRDGIIAPDPCRDKRTGKLGNPLKSGCIIITNIPIGNSLSVWESFCRAVHKADW